jgi:hypothetical protein
VCVKALLCVKTLNFFVAPLGTAKQATMIQNCPLVASCRIPELNSIFSVSALADGGVGGLLLRETIKNRKSRRRNQHHNGPHACQFSIRPISALKTAEENAHQLLNTRA